VARPRPYTSFEPSRRHARPIRRDTYRWPAFRRLVLASCHAGAGLGGGHCDHLANCWIAQLDVRNTFQRARQVGRCCANESAPGAFSGFFQVKACVQLRRLASVVWGSAQGALDGARGRGGGRPAVQAALGLPLWCRAGLGAPTTIETRTSMFQPLT